MSKKNNKKKLLNLANQNLNTQIKSYTAPRPQTNVSSKRVPLQTLIAKKQVVRPNSNRATTSSRSRKKPTQLNRAQIVRKEQILRYQRLRALEQKALANQKNTKSLNRIHAGQLTIQKQIQKAEDRFQKKQMEQQREEACRQRKEREQVINKIIRKTGLGSVKLKKIFKNMKNAKRTC